MSADSQNHPAPRDKVWRRLLGDRLAAASGAFLLLVLLCAVLAPVLAPHSPYETDLRARLLPVGSPGHPLGTDHVGRDVFSRLLYGGRASLLVGLSAVAMAMLGGVPLGLTSGYFRGWLDAVAMRGIDILMAFPSILLAIAVIASLGPGLFKAMIAVSIVGIPYYTRIVRSSVMAVREKEFVEAARSMGAGTGRVLFHHVFSNCLAPLIVAATLDVGWMITAAAGLSFLGLGAQPPMAEWGVMLSEGRAFIRVAPHLSILPGLAIFFVLLALNLLGDGLRDALDPRLRNLRA